MKPSPKNSRSDTGIPACVGFEPPTAEVDETLLPAAAATPDTESRPKGAVPAVREPDFQNRAGLKPLSSPTPPSAVTEPRASASGPSVGAATHTPSNADAALTRRHFFSRTATGIGA